MVCHRASRGKAARVLLSPGGRAALLGSVLAVGLLRLTASAQEPARKTQELLRLIPPDSGVVLAVDDLREHVRAVLKSKLAAEFLKLPAVKTWFDSEKYADLRNTREQVEGMLQADLTEIRDKVLGDAVVFALHFPSKGPGTGAVDPADASGVLLLKASDPALLAKVIDLLNTIQKNNGELTDIVGRKRGETSYFLRELPPGADHRFDAYVAFPDGTFAISGSEELIQQVIDRKTGATGGPNQPAGPGVAEKFSELARRLPREALATMFVDPGLVLTLLEHAPKKDSDGIASLAEYVRAHEYAGAALTFEDGNLALRVAEVFQPGKFGDLFGSWSEEAKRSSASLDRVPPSTMLVGSIQLDFTWMYRTLKRSLPERDSLQLANAETALRGLLLGQDLPARILPALGPRVFLAIGAPEEEETRSQAERAARGNWPFPTVLAVELASPPAESPAGRVAVADALDNALTTLLALTSLDHHKNREQARIVTREAAGATVVKTLSPPVPFAYAVDRPGNRLVLGLSSEAVERYLAAGADQAAGERFRRLHSRGFAESQSFLCLDLTMIRQFAERHRDRLADALAREQKRPRADVAHDLEQVLALCTLFDAAYLTSRIDAKSATVLHTLGVLDRASGPESTRAQP